MKVKRVEIRVVKRIKLETKENKLGGLLWASVAQISVAQISVAQLTVAQEAEAQLILRFLAIE